MLVILCCLFHVGYFMLFVFRSPFPVLRFPFSVFRSPFFHRSQLRSNIIKFDAVQTTLTKFPILARFSIFYHVIMAVWAVSLFPFYGAVYYPLPLSFASEMEKGMFSSSQAQLQRLEKTNQLHLSI